MVLSVKTHLLAAGLEKGLGQTESFLISGIPEKDRLRYQVCGLVSTAISSYAQTEGLDSYLLASSPKLSFDPEMTHVVPVISVPGEVPVVIDATPSQFLGYAGLSPHYEYGTGQSILPAEKIIVFDIDNPYIVVRWLTKAIERFHESDVQEEMLGMGGNPLLYSSKQEQEHEFNKIYELNNLKPWEPSDGTLEAAVDIANRLPGGLIASK